MNPVRRALSAVIVAAALVVFRPEPAGAQSAPARFDAGLQVVASSSQQFEGSDFGIGGRFAWHPVDALGVESELNLYPGDYPGAGVAFSGRRVEGLFGVTAGPRFNRVRLFGRVRAGFLDMAAAPEIFPCIAIFPPPLACTLAAGQTLAIVDLGGGVEASVTPRTFIRVDAGDRLTKYPGPAFDGSGTRRDDAFYGHGFRFAAGAGLRF